MCGVPLDSPFVFLRIKIGQFADADCTALVNAAACCDANQDSHGPVTEICCLVQSRISD